MLHFLKNKYFITVVFFLTTILFFDRYDVFSQLDLRKQLFKLQKEKSYYQKEIKNNNDQLYELRTNPENLEQFAREHYLMKKQNEDVFVIVNDSLLKD